jgi:hypothetical protein
VPCQALYRTKIDMQACFRAKLLNADENENPACKTGFA